MSEEIGVVEESVEVGPAGWHFYQVEIVQIIYKYSSDRLTLSLNMT